MSELLNSNAENIINSRGFRNIDTIGIFCSGACAAHCLLIPVLTFFSPALTSYFENEWIHIALLIFVIPIAGFSFYKQSKIHKSYKSMKLGIVGVTFLMVPVALEQVFDIHSKSFEIGLSMIGSFFLIKAHLYNIKSLNSFREEG